MKEIKKNNMRLLSFLISFVMAASLFTGVGSTTAYANTTDNTIDLSSGNIVISDDNTYTVGEGNPVTYDPSQPLVVTQSDSTEAIDCRIKSNAASVKIELSGVNVSTDESFIDAAGDVDLTVSGKNTVSVIPESSFDAAIYVYNSLNISGEGTLDINANYIGIQAIVTVDGSRLTITGTEDSECGIYSDCRNVKINSGTVKITGFKTGIESCNSDVKMNGGTVTIASKEYGIDVVNCNVTMKDGCNLIIESEDTAINKDDNSAITVDENSADVTVYMGVSAESATHTTYAAGETITLPTPEPPTSDGPPESNFKYFSTVAPAIEEEPDAVNWSTFKDGDVINAGTIIYNDTSKDIKIFVDTYAAAVEDELIDDDSYKNTDDFETYRYTYYDSIIIQPGKRYQVLDKYTSGSTAGWYSGLKGYEFGAESWKLYTEDIEHILYPAEKPVETPPSGGEESGTRTTPLDFTDKADTPAWQTDCTQSGDVWTNETENWSWDTATNTLTLSGFKFVNENAPEGFVAILLPRESHIYLERGTENSVNVRSSSFCVAIGSNSSLTISGAGELDITSSYMGIMPGGNITINSPISVKSTSNEKSAMAIAIASDNEDYTITIADTLEITKPDGATYAGLMILDGDGNFAKEVVISAKGGIAKYTVTFDATGGTLSNYTSTTNNSGKLASLPTPTRDGYVFKGWYDAVTGGNQITTDTVFTQNTTIYARWIKTYSVSGNVVNEAGEGTPETPVVGATVTIKNNTIEKTDTTGADGSFTLSDIPAGEYNIVVTKDGKTVTKLVKIENADVSGINVVIPTKNLSSVVEVKPAASGAPATPAVLVGGLDELAKAKENEGMTVVVKLTVEQKAEDAVEETAKNEIVVAAAKDQLEYLDMKVNKTVDGGSPTLITDTGKVLEIIVPYDMAGKYNIAVYRHHDDQAQAFRKLTVRPTSGYQDGTFFVGDDFIVIYTSKFSYYAVGYDTTPSTPSGSGSSGGGGGTYTYSISVPDKIAGGKVSISPKNAAKGATVTITVEPEENQKLDKLTVTDRDGNEIKLTKKSEDKYTFVMPAGKVSIDAVFTAVEAVPEQETDTTVEDCSKDSTCPMKHYNDIKVTEWYHDGVHFCIDNDYMKGYPDGTFQPNTATSRAMIVSILWRMEGKPVVNDTLTFTDVKANDWYTEAIRWAASNKVVNGYSDTEFAPNDAITREQMMTILWNYCKYKGFDVSVGEDTNILSYKDANNISGWAIPAMQWACGSGLIYGMDNNTLDAQGNATRAQAANILYRFAK